MSGAELYLCNTIKGSKEAAMRRMYSIPAGSFIVFVTAGFGLVGVMYIFRRNMCVMRRLSSHGAGNAFNADSNHGSVRRHRNGVMELCTVVEQQQVANRISGRSPGVQSKRQVGNEAIEYSPVLMDAGDYSGIEV